jgi:hypothetical protein
MPLIQSITPPTPARIIQKANIQNTQFSAMQMPGQSTQNKQSNETGDQAIEPAAPPSALQMQIKALISEQLETLFTDAGQEPAKPS